jgi:ketosteroid isomerase-like protein
MADLDRLVRDYNAACSHGTVEEITAFVTPDAVIYDLNHPPVVGRVAIGRFWDRIRTKWGGATWDVDRTIGDGTSVAAEWTMHGTTADGPFAFHGVDLYEFDDDLIREIRQYWRFDPDEPGSGLVGFAYGETPSPTPSA